MLFFRMQGLEDAYISPRSPQVTCFYTLRNRPIFNASLFYFDSFIQIFFLSLIREAIVQIFHPTERGWGEGGVVIGRLAGNAMVPMLFAILATAFFLTGPWFGADRGFLGGRGRGCPT